MTPADPQAFKAWRADPAAWRPLVAAIAASHGLSGEPTPFATGTNLVVALGAGVILKVFPPIYRAQFRAERATLAQLRGRVAVAIPQVLAEGERDGFAYLVLTRVAGVSGEIGWPLASEADKVAILREIGETIAEVQRAPPGSLAQIEPAWPFFLRTQIAGARARHERLGLPHRYLEALDVLLAEAATIVPLDAAPVILTGEYIPENFLLRETARGWRLAGLIDFGDVMTGWREYDLLGPSAFLAAGDRDRVRALFAGFGYGEADLTPELQRRLMALMLLHRASDPIRHIAIPGWLETTRDLDHLQTRLWPF